MSALFGIVGILGFLVCFILLIIQAIRKKSLKKIAILLLVFFACFVVGIAIPSNDTSETQNHNTKISETTQVETTQAETTVESSSADSSVESDATTTNSLFPNSQDVGEWSITVNGFSFQNEISAGLITAYQAKDGNYYAVVDLSVMNNGTTADTFLPVISFDGGMNAKITYGKYEYDLTYLVGYEKNLVGEEFNPLISTDGAIVFEMPAQAENSSEPLYLVISDADSSATFQLR